MKKVLHHTRFAPNPFGHGGERRATQIKEYYLARGLELDSLIIIAKRHFCLSYIIKSFLVMYRVYGCKNWKSVRRFLKWWKYMYHILPDLEKYFKQEADLFVWESTMEVFNYLPYLAHKYGKKVYAYPHNIETLVVGQTSSISGKHSPSGFAEEVEALKQCDKVYLISRFDNQLLTLFGVDSEYWSYDPPMEILRLLKSIKEKRLTKEQGLGKRFLILGTVHNPPTRIGMEILLDLLNKLETPNVSFIVAGFGTEIFKNKVLNPSIELKGSMSDSDLEQEMILCNALLIYQKPTTGVLTRVTEFLLAGIPVILNVESAHSFFEKENLYVYESEEQLVQLINSSIVLF